LVSSHQGRLYPQLQICAFLTLYTELPSLIAGG
jgi:hypothetical protein